MPNSEHWIQGFLIWLVWTPPALVCCHSPLFTFFAAPSIHLKSLNVPYCFRTLCLSICCSICLACLSFPFLSGELLKFCKPLHYSTSLVLIPSLHACLSPGDSEPLRHRVCLLRVFCFCYFYLRERESEQAHV